MADAKSNSEQIMQDVLDVQNQALKVNIVAGSGGSGGSGGTVTVNSLIPKNYGIAGGSGQPSGWIQLGELIPYGASETNIIIKSIKIYTPFNSVIRLGTVPFYGSASNPDALNTVFAVIGPGSHDIPVNITAIRGGSGNLSATTLAISCSQMTAYTGTYQIGFTSFVAG